MGAHLVTKVVHTDADMNAAWRRLYDNERDEFGYDAYSGSFATCSFMGLGSRESFTRTAAETFASDRDEHLSKGDAYALRLVESARTVSKTSTITVAATGGSAASKTARIDVAAVAAALNVAPSTIASIKVVSATPKHKVQRPVFGAGRRVYAVTGVAERFVRRSDAVAAAKAALERRTAATATSHDWFTSSEVQIDEIVERATAPKFVSELVSVKAKIEVTMTSGALTPVGWYFYGMASS